MEKDTIVTISKEEIPDDVEILKVNTVSDYKKLINAILGGTSEDTIQNTSDSISRGIRNASSNEIILKERKMYTASNVVANFNLSAMITIYKNKVVHAESPQMTLSGVTAFHKLVNKDFEIKYNSSQTVVRVQCNYGIQYYIATPWGSYEMVTDNKNQYFHFSYEKGIYDYDAVG